MQAHCRRHDLAVAVYGEEPAFGNNLVDVVRQLLVVPRVEVRQGHEVQKRLLIAFLIGADCVAGRKGDSGTMRALGSGPDHVQLWFFLFDDAHCASFISVLRNAERLHLRLQRRAAQSSQL
jgi:hypothetical protein